MINEVLNKVRISGAMQQILKTWYYAVDTRNWDLAAHCHDEYYAKKEEYDKIGKLTPLKSMKGFEND